jgi:hypothetical protein
MPHIFNAAHATDQTPPPPQNGAVQDRDVQTLRDQAARCRRLAADVGGDPASRVLARMADEYDTQLRALKLHR